jgi:hypothetical protein
LRLVEQVHELEPFVPIYNIGRAIAMIADGQNQAAISVLEAMPPDGNGYRNEVLAWAYAAVGRFGDAADAILAIPKARYGDSGKSIEDAARLMRSAPAKTTAPESLPVLPGRLSFVYAYVGAPDRIMEFFESVLEAGMADSAGFRFLFDPSSAPVRKTERFKTFVRNMGLVAYWRARGWPDLCHPTTGDDFVCN